MAESRDDKTPPGKSGGVLKCDRLRGTLALAMSAMRAYHG